MSFTLGQTCPRVISYAIQQYKEDNIGIGYGILAFLIPIAGWIMYFVWKDSTPHRASQANTLAWIGFILNLICFWASM